MPSVHIDNVGKIAIIECVGRFVREEAALKLRDAVISQADARIVVLDLTEMHAIGSGGLGTLLLLQKWAQDNNIRFQLFNPCGSVRDKLKHVEFECASLEQMIGILGSPQVCTHYGQLPGTWISDEKPIPT
jgi:anti-anti-sigma regulatory factor